MGTADTKWGLEKESFALSELSEQLRKPFRKSGFFIDVQYPFLGASPDAISGEDEIAEIKCPSSIKEMSPQEAFKNNKLKFLQENNGVLRLKENHNYYYQVQGQLNITQANVCYFVVWSPKGILIDTILKDATFWSREMIPKLEKFYWECLLPEIVDSRKARGRAIRDTDYIESAKKEEAKRKTGSVTQ